MLCHFYLIELHWKSGIFFCAFSNRAVWKFPITTGFHWKFEFLTKSFSQKLSAFCRKILFFIKELESSWTLAENEIYLFGCATMVPQRNCNSLPYVPILLYGSGSPAWLYAPLYIAGMGLLWCTTSPHPQGKLWCFIENVLWPRELVWERGSMRHLNLNSHEALHQDFPIRISGFFGGNISDLYFSWKVSNYWFSFHFGWKFYAECLDFSTSSSQ